MITLPQGYAQMDPTTKEQSLLIALNTELSRQEELIKTLTNSVTIAMHQLSLLSNQAMKQDKEITALQASQPTVAVVPTNAPTAVSPAKSSLFERIFRR